MAKLVQKLSNQRDIEIDYRVVKGANHLFTDRLDKLGAHVDAYLAESLTAQRPGRAREREKTAAR